MKLNDRTLKINDRSPSTIYCVEIVRRQRRAIRKLQPRDTFANICNLTFIIFLEVIVLPVA